MLLHKIFTNVCLFGFTLETEKETMSLLTIKYEHATIMPISYRILLVFGV